MKALHLAVVIGAMPVLLVLAPAKGDARPPIGIISPPPSGGHMHGFHGGFFVVEREVVIEREIVHEKPADPLPPAAPPPPPPRKSYVIGKTYASLPGGCMKLIDRGSTYYLCSGEWYRQVGSARYKAVAQP